MFHVVEVQKSKLDHVTVHHHNMVVKAVQDQPHPVLVATLIHVQLMEAGAPGALMDPVVHHVVEEQKSRLDHVTIQSLNMVVKPVQDQPLQVPAATQIHVQLMEAGAPGAPMDPAVLHVVEELKSELDPATVHNHNMVVRAA